MVSSKRVSIHTKLPWSITKDTTIGFSYFLIAWAEPFLSSFECFVCCERVLAGYLSFATPSFSQDSINLTSIMHQPLARAYKERVRDGDGEIIHRLAAALNDNALHHAAAAIGLAHLIAEHEVAGRCPALVLNEERVFGRGLNAFTIDGQVNDRGVEVHQHGGDTLTPPSSNAWRR